MQQSTNLTLEQLLLIYDNIHDLVFLIEVVGKSRYRVASVNRAYLQSTQLDPGDIIGRAIEDVLRPEQVAYVTSRYDEAVAGGGPHRYETRTRMRRTTVYLDTTLVPIFDERQRCTHLIGVSRDISRSKAEQRALRKEKQRAENYLEISEAVILALDTECNISMLNRKGYTMLDYPPGSLVGRNWCDLVIAPEKRETFMRNYRRVIKTGEVGKNVNYVSTRTGQRILISWSNALIRDDDGAVAGVLSSGEDISDRHRAEQAMIAGQRVLAADEVVSAVAHDFNNSLQGILGNIEIAMAVADRPEQLHKHLHSAGKLADDAARRLKVLRSGRAGEAAGEAEVLDLHELIEDVIAQTQPMWKDEVQRHGRDVRLVRDFARGVPPTEGNGSELRSVLYNIVKNAIEALPGDGEVRFSTSFEKGFNVIAITDTGVGMDRETSTRIFQPFFSTKGLEPGRGLGMSSSHSIVAAHRGELRVRQSSPGRGTSIELRLPAVMPPEGAPVSGAADGAPRLHHILWVEDDAEVAEVAASYITALHHRGDVARGGQQALELLAQRRYSVMISDVGMPGMSGLELAAHAERLTGGHMPVILITGWGESVAEGQPLPAGVHEVVAKPVRLGRLREILAGLPVLRDAGDATLGS